MSNLTVLYHWKQLAAWSELAIKQKNIDLKDAMKWGLAVLPYNNATIFLGLTMIYNISLDIMKYTSSH